MFNFELGDTIYYIRENKLHSGRVWTRMVVENAHDDWAHTDAQKNIWQCFGPSQIAYVTCHGVIMQGEAYKSVNDMINALCYKTLG